MQKGSTLHTGTHGTQQLQWYTTFTVEHNTHSGTQHSQWCTTITVVHNIHSGAQHIRDTETFGLPEGQP